MEVLKLQPAYKDYLWGGHRLVEEYNKKYDGDILAETWEFSCHPDGPSVIMNGDNAGKTLKEYIECEGKKVLGKNCKRFRDFPILTKFIDAKQNFSIQVHPDNKYALKNEGQYGKTEMWYVVDAGEAVAGAGRSACDIVMLTLGTGVGGGILLTGKIFGGQLTGGCELGHMVIYENGEMCTCGRKGCLEAYASATALVRDTKRAMQKDADSVLWKMCEGDLQNVTAKMPFDAAESGDQTAQKIVEDYICHLSIGITSSVNIFRPEMVLLGGGVSVQGHTLTDKINQRLKIECFDGVHGQIPEVKIAELGNKAGMIGAASLVG